MTNPHDAAALAIVNAPLPTDTKKKRKYKKGPKWHAYIKRVKSRKHRKVKHVKKNTKKKHSTLAEARREYIRYIGHGLHHIQNQKSGRKEIWEATRTPDKCCLKYKNSFIKFRCECAPTVKGINA